jgi:hypothetical protein
MVIRIEQLPAFKLFNTSFRASLLLWGDALFMKNEVLSYILQVKQIHPLLSSYLFRTFAFTLLECQHEKERFARKENTLTEKDGGKHAILFRTQKQSKTGEEKSGETRTLY